MVWSNINISHRSKLISKAIRILPTTHFYDKQKNCNICALVLIKAKPISELRSLEHCLFGNTIRTAVKLTFLDFFFFNSTECDQGAHEVQGSYGRNSQWARV